MQKILIVINDAPYGTEKAYNALRLAMTLVSEHENVKTRVLLMADAVGCAIPDQQTPKGYYNIETMIKYIIGEGAEVKACGGCLYARGFSELKLIDGIEPSNMPEFTEWTVEADKVVTF
ncbi:MAG: DsrE family protein [Candidatus Cloacimonadales bacterium]|nr:DsrE family protein [Candidatus Cloacimonadales bacterium]